MIGGEEAIQELQRLQQSNAFPGVRWLSHAVLQIEDRLLTEGSAIWESGPLLDFVNKESLGIVLNERDLFEWVCQGVDNVQEATELRGEAVTAFWNGDQPKTEPECQNVLWPLIQLTLQKSMIAVVEGEEKSIGPNRCDFWIEYPRRGKQPFRVAIELKTARMGYGTGELIDPVETQLWEKYLRTTGCQHGIFIVLWFRDNQRYRGPAHWANRDALVEELRKKCKEVEAAHYPVTLASYVIDVTAPFRRH